MHLFEFCTSNTTIRGYFRCCLRRTRSVFIRHWLPQTFVFSYRVANRNNQPSLACSATLWHQSARLCCCVIGESPGEHPGPGAPISPFPACVYGSNRSRRLMLRFVTRSLFLLASAVYTIFVFVQMIRGATKWHGCMQRSHRPTICLTHFRRLRESLRQLCERNCI